ncbi:hypothetical protein EW026_g5691 [Hermanssonia centrifuga]|uniref:Uncharacterized protein n=1 Tax=Hermanssonia centrifuga TaxID=98765 RepID=A0A4V3X9Z7_9APHY|nr:hypothetical protein EW026_g5691 [Hermanssonia centrifuga]
MQWQVRKRTKSGATYSQCTDQELLVALSNLVNRIARVFASVSYLESQVTSLRTQVTTLRAQKTLNSAAQVTHECAQLRNNVQKLKAKKAALEKRKEEEIGKMQKKVRNLVEKVAIYESKEKRCKARIAKLESQLSSGQQYIAHLEETSRVAVQEKTALETQLQFQTYNHEYNASLPSLHTSDVSFFCRSVTSASRLMICAYSTTD